MRLFVCYGTFGPAERHACGRAFEALTAAGHRPEVVRTYGCFGDESQSIVAWAEQNPPGRASQR